MEIGMSNSLAEIKAMAVMVFIGWVIPIGMSWQEMLLRFMLPILGGAAWMAVKPLIEKYRKK